MHTGAGLGTPSASQHNVFDSEKNPHPKNDSDERDPVPIMLHCHYQDDSALDWSDASQCLYTLLIIYITIIYVTNCGGQGQSH